MWSRKREVIVVVAVMWLCFVMLTVNANATDYRESSVPEVHPHSNSFSDHAAFKKHRKNVRCFGGRCAHRRAVKFLGNVCWDVSISALGDTPISMKLGVTHMGGGHFMLNGVLGAIEEGEDEVEFSLVRGNSEMVEGKRRLSLDNTAGEVFDHPVLGNNLQGNGAVLYNLVLDPKTLDGNGFGGAWQTGNLEDLNVLFFLGEVTVKKISCKNVIWRQEES